MLLPRRRGLYIKVLLAIPASWLLISLLISFNNQNKSDVSLPGHVNLGDGQEASAWNGNGYGAGSVVSDKNRLPSKPTRSKSKNRKSLDRMNLRKGLNVSRELVPNIVIVFFSLSFLACLTMVGNRHQIGLCCFVTVSIVHRDVSVPLHFILILNPADGHCRFMSLP